MPLPKQCYCNICGHLINPDGRCMYCGYESPFWAVLWKEKKK